MNTTLNNQFTLKFLLLMVVFMSTQAVAATAEWCEDQWKIDSSKSYYQNPPDFPNLLKVWKGHSKECSGTIAYEARLAFAYLFLKDVNQARAVLTPFINKQSKYSYLVEFALLHADSVKYEIEGKLNEENVSKLEAKYIYYVKKYPDFPDAFGMLGGYQAYLHKYNEAIKSLEVGLNTRMNPGVVYRNLTVSYAAVGRYDDALKASGKAVELNKELTSDPDFVYAIAKSDAALGDYQSAQTALKVILAKVPEVKTTAEFKETLQFVIHEIDKKTN